MNTLQSTEFWLAAIFVMIAIATGFGMFARWCAHSPAVRPDQMAKLCVGMTSAEVVAIIGQPRQTKVGEKGMRHWTYGAPMKRHALVIDFGPQDKMLSFTHGVPGQRQQSRRFPGA
jgi:outer membrane protein assembly factor BamE (lipoprotein component of BamABCDE complex)